MPDAYCDKIINELAPMWRSQSFKVVGNVQRMWWDRLIRYGYDRTFAYHAVYG